MATGPLAPVVHYLRKVTSPAAFGELPDAELLARFARQRDEAAFTALVRRHGPMVLAVCRRVVRDGHAAEDAFQGTFLVLARKADSLAQPELLGNWLYGVAYRTAMKARRDAAKRRAHETQAVRAQDVGPSEEIDGQDLRAVVDEEINRLPQRYRVPVVLCYLQGQTNAEAARRLGCSRGTIATLLARARDKLRRRLTQRGIGLSVGVALGTLNSTMQGGTVPLVLANVTVKAATLLSAGHTQAAGALAAQAVALAKGVSKAMLFEKLKIPVAILIVTALVGTGAGVSAYRTGDPSSEVADSEQEAKPRQENKTESQKKLDGKRSGESLRKPPAAPLARHSFRGELPTTTVPFSQILVLLGEDGRLTVCQKAVSYRPVTEEVTLKSGRKHSITTYEEECRNCVAVLPIDKVRVYDTKGRKIEAKELRKRLKGETLALVLFDDGPIDPLHLRLYKEDTLVFVIDPRRPPAAVAPPAVGVSPFDKGAIYAPGVPAPPVVPPLVVPAPPTVVPPPRADGPEDKVPPMGS
jgi:RNA polymerase sigma factor (sigma-70 family)